MKKIMTVLLTLALLLCACTPVSSGGDAATTDPSTTADPHAWIRPEWKVPGEMTDEKRQEIKKALSAKDGIDHTGHIDYEENCVCGMVWCGTWGGCEILMEKDISGRVNATIDQSLFTAGTFCYAYKDGVLYSLQDVFSAGDVTKADLEKLVAINKEMDWAKRGFMPDGMTAALRKEIRSAYAKRFTGEYADSILRREDRYVQVVCGMPYYGIHDGYVILEDDVSDLDWNMGTEQIGNEVFSKEHPILCYRDGQFQSLKDAYEAGKISAETVSQIAEIRDTFTYLLDANGMILEIG